jgi:hypothetical protein
MALNIDAIRTTPIAQDSHTFPPHRARRNCRGRKAKVRHWEAMAKHQEALGRRGEQVPER